MQFSTETALLRGLRFHVRSWRPGAGQAASGLTVVLVHGFADEGGSWAEVAPTLVARGHVVVAPDLRGFGRTEWVGAGGYYHFPDYVADLDALIERVGPGRVALVGHSMGGMVSTLYAGARPDRVERMAVLEGLGPPSSAWADAPTRTAAWLDAMRGGGRPPRRSMTHREALDRLAVQHPGIDREQLVRHLPELAVEGDDGGLSWRLDPLHRTVSPVPFFVESFAAFAARVACPVLVVTGGEQGYRPPDEAERIAWFRDARVVDLPGAGHMMHWSSPDRLGPLLAGFLDEAAAGGA